MEDSYRFFNNKKCAYMPCHKVDNTEDFNCLFCYCPLYLMEECGGNYKMAAGIKDCSDCLLPHRPKGYDYIVKKFREYNQKKAEEYIANLEKEMNKDND